ncbi:glycosyl hydrolase [Kibdelosporangium lantanae]|uniref:Glycosyl hydrolase n=1 Tax=Kibdelosporangium lantanae TaxID=1497396 RepID=A0ABW3M6Q9_9PSEU
MPSKHLTSIALSTILATTVGTPVARAADPVSPLLWGENLGLYRDTLDRDWFLTNPDLRAGLKAAHTAIIRMPVRGPSDNPTDSGWGNEPEFKQAAQDVEQLGLAPLVILRAGPPTAQTLDVDLDVVDHMTDLFGDRTVCYEFGNEPDLGGSGFIPADDYVAKWNAVVPALRQAAGPNARFVGPVTYQYDEPYLRTFLRGVASGARPDMVSWHTYTCDTPEPEEDCLNENGIEAWPDRFAAARRLMTTTLGHELPIWITEWNFNAHDTLGSDPKLRDQQFVRDWTRKAIQTLAENGVGGSMHYNVEDLLPLVTPAGAPTTQGKAFKEKYEELAGSPPGLRYTFEDGALSGWSKTGNVTAYAVSTTAGGQDGTHALRATFSSSNAGDLPYLHVNPPGGGPKAGQTYSAYVYLPTDVSTSVVVKLYVQDNADNWHTSNNIVIGQRGSWVRTAFTPDGYTGAAKQIGVQFGETPVNTATTVYLDSVTWS